MPQGIVRDPCLSFDAKKILVSLRRDINDDYHIYEYSLDLAKKQAADGRAGDETRRNPVETTDGPCPGVSDIDPIYLPGGDIMFSSSREPKYCMCNRHIMCNLYTLNGDGSNIQQVGKSTLFEGHASLTPSGPHPVRPLGICRPELWRRPGNLDHEPRRNESRDLLGEQHPRPPAGSLTPAFCPARIP